MVEFYVGLAYHCAAWIPFLIYNIYMSYWTTHIGDKGIVHMVVEACVELVLCCAMGIPFILYDLDLVSIGLCVGGCALALITVRPALRGNNDDVEEIVLYGVARVYSGGCHRHHSCYWRFEGFDVNDKRYTFDLYGRDKKLISNDCPTIRVTQRVTGHYILAIEILDEDDPDYI